MKLIVPGMFARLRGSTPTLARRLRKVRLLEAVAETSAPQLVRGGAGGGTSVGSDGDGDGDDGNRATKDCPTCEATGIKDGDICPTCEGSGLIKAAIQESVALNPLTEGTFKLREANGMTGGPVYEVELLSEGPGNKRDNVFYTAQALREAVSSGVFNGMQAYADHPGKDEEANRPERSVRTLVGYYRNVRFVESGSKGKPAAVAELVVNKGQKWFVDLLESAIAARGDGVQLCGISIDGGGLVEAGEVAGQRMNICRKITEAPSADVVTRAAAGGTIVRRLRESVARTHLPSPQEAHTMKLADFTPKLTAAHAKIRESFAALTKEGASDEDVKGAVTGLREAEAELADLAKAEIEQEVKVEFREAEGAGDAAAVEVKLQEAEAKVTELTTERDELRSKNTSLERAQLAAKVLREAEVPADKATSLFNTLVTLDGEDAMKAHLESVKAYEEDLFARFRESLGIGAPASVEGAGALRPIGSATPTGGGAERLAEAGIPILPEQAAA
jgi:hypothetical protein